MTGVQTCALPIFRLSANILKNAMGVGIPGTGMVGLPIAIALGSLVGKSAYGLEVLRDLTPEALDEGKRMVDSKSIHISLKENVDKLYIEIESRAGDSFSKVIICHEHTHFVYVEKNGEVLLDERVPVASSVSPAPTMICVFLFLWFMNLLWKLL